VVELSQPPVLRYFSLAVGLRKPPVLIDFHWRFVRATASVKSAINTPSSPPDRTLTRSQPPLEAFMEIRICQNTRGEVFFFISLEEVAKKGRFMYLLPLFNLLCSI
jgi:hypothetical protein